MTKHLDMPDPELVAGAKELISQLEQNDYPVSARIVRELLEAYNK